MSPASVSAEKSATPKTVLIIDDDVHLAAVMALGLETNGYGTLCAANAAIGLEMASAHMPDLILCDIDMPGKDGRRLLQQLRADPKLADRQFVLMTGRSTLANQRSGMDLGADDFLLKPFDLPSLIRCVEARIARAGHGRRLDEGGIDTMRESLQSSLPHEFFKPLAGILGLTELLQKDLDGLGKEEIREYLGEIHDAGRRLHRRLSNYLLILDIESSTPSREGSALNPDSVAVALCGGASAAAERYTRAADLTVDVTGAPVRARASDLRALADELVDNALNFSGPGTPVRVRARPENGRLLITVVDVGRGMSPRQLEQQEVRRTADRRLYDQEGPGLGIALVRNLTTHLGGEFRLESEPGRGTTAHVSLPIVETLA